MRPQYCKCRECGFCKAGADATSAADAPQTAANAALAAPAKKSRKKGAAAGRGSAAEAGGVSPAQTGTPAASGSRTKCLSTMKGDWPYETCGAFCKAEKKGNHCKVSALGGPRGCSRSGTLVPNQPS